ncbi:MAG: serine--tRNA ligase, partial [Candidatus Gracilibacteria bacterium]|nr:serine--tRNA ligase [Candidatus Gracilibacteria bacterium]
LEGAEREKAIAAMQGSKEDFKQQEQELKGLEERFQKLMLQIPSPALDRVPVGKDDQDNVEIRTWGNLPTFDFEPKDHVQLGEDLDIIDIPRGVKISGSRFYFLKNEGALLEMAVLKYTLDKLVAKGFTAFIPPVLVQYEAMMATGYFPGGEEQAYAVGSKAEREAAPEDDGLYLVGTSEVSVASYHQGEILEEKQLPLLYAGISNCFRREAGTYGKDTQGLYRIHQFQKVEQVVICKNDPEESTRLHALILANAEEVLQDFKLPYRVVDVCTGDMGQGQIYKNDIETWMPSRKNYGETHSCSTFHEFQARRLNLRYRDAEGNKSFCHTLNNTCIASPRILIPLLEIYQQKDGSVEIPEVLRPYMGGKGKIVTKEK